MRRPSSLVLACLTLFFGLLPVVLVKPGWPAGLKADEPAYYLMAKSLAHDLDLRLESRDLERLFDEFPYAPARNLILASDDGWHSVFFGKPYLYSLVAAPFVGLFGAGGMIAFNVLLMMAMVALGRRYLLRYNDDAVATLFATGFFLLSAGFAYIFWMHPEVFNMAAVTACLYFGLTGGPLDESSGRPGRWGGRFRASPAWRAVVSGTALAAASYSKPMLALLGLPVLFVLWRRHRWRASIAWTAGATAAMGLFMLVAVAFTGKPSAYLGWSRGGFHVCSPDEMPVDPIGPPPPAEAAQKATGAAGDEPAVAAAGTDREATGADVRADVPGTSAVRADVPGTSAGTSAGADADESEVSVKRATPRTKSASWSWILRWPRLPWGWVVENLGYFLWGRHAGLFPYFPFSLLALGLFLIHGRRDAARWVVLAALAGVALFFVLMIPVNWQGGGGFVGNRYFVNAYPGFLFLITRLTMRGLPSGLVPALGYGLGGLLLAPVIFTPMGRGVPWPTLQAHVRNFPFTHLPLELSLKYVPGYEEQTYGEVRVRGRQDVFLPRGAPVWIHGATPVELWLQSTRPLESYLLQVSSPAAPNDIELSFGDDRQRLEIGAAAAGHPHRVELRPGGPDKVRNIRGTPIYAYRLVIEPATGEVRPWTRTNPPRTCVEFAYNAEFEESFYIGAEIVFLGSAERLERDLYAVDWGRVEGPAQAVADSVFTLRTRVSNASGETWPVALPTAVRLAYRWLDEEGEPMTVEVLRTELPGPVEAGGEVDLTQSVRAPPVPGRYVLEVDLVYEMVAWFSTRNGDDVARLPLEIVAASTE